MNFLHSCLARYGRVTFWNTPCCRDVVRHQVITDDQKCIARSNKPMAKFQIELCTNKSVSCVPTQWTQVRYCNKQCPRLHRDVEFPNFDAYRKEEYIDVRKTNWGAGDGKSGYTYVVGFFGFLCGTYGVKSVATHFIMYMAAAADVLALASIDVDLSKIGPGACLSYKWRGKPLFVKNRTEADIALESQTPLSALRDPETQEQRTIKPEWLIVIGICTHLGCVPIPNSGDYAGGFYCPCHGSHYDNVGRARKGPAPLNLEVPPYKFVSDTLVLVG